MVSTMDQRAIVRYISDTYAGVDVESPDDGPGAGDTFFIYDPNRNLDAKHRWPRVAGRTRATADQRE